MEDFYNQVRERMICYAKINTRSEFYSGVWPTTECQLTLAIELAKEMKRMGVPDVLLDREKCLVYGKIPSNQPGKKGKPTGLIAHLDTAPFASGENVQPWVLECYDGGEIVLNKEKNIRMSPLLYPNLRRYVGQDLILTDGTTLLGGDDKAAISAIMTMLQYICEHPEFPHGLISVAFTPDEEVSGLAHDLDLQLFESPVAYTLDGDHLGYIEDENFNAAEAVLVIKGRSVHTGTAKGIMINAVDIAEEFMHSLPEKERPQFTDGRQGFFHIVSCQATCEMARIHLIIRDFDEKGFQQRIDYVRKCADRLADKYGKDHITLSISPQYRNMKEIVDQVPYLVENLKQAVAECGVQVVMEPFRGGTDGSTLSQRGLPCPNLSAGYENAHGRFEYVPIQSMVKNVQILLKLLEIYSRG